MEEPFYIRAGTLSPGFEGELIPYFVKEGSTATFTMRDRVGTALVEGTAELVEDLTGAAPRIFARYPWVAGDTDVPGLHFGFVTVTYGDTTNEVFPTPGAGFPILIDKAV